MAPVLQAEGRIGDDPVIGQQPSLRVHQPRLGDDVAGLQPRRPQAVEQQVQLADGQRPQVALLPVEHQVADVAAPFLHVLGGVDQHPAGPGGGVADAHPLLRLQQLDDQPHHLAGCVELAALLAGVVGELVDEVLVGVAQHVAGVHLAVAQVGVAEVQPGEVVQELADEALAVGRAAQLLLIVPVDAGQHALEAADVIVFYRVAGHVQRLSQAHGLAGDDGPAGIIRHEELVLVGISEGSFPGYPPRKHRALNLLVEAVGQPLQEEDGEDVVLVVCRVDLPPRRMSAACHSLLCSSWLVSGMVAPQAISTACKASCTIAARTTCRHILATRISEEDTSSIVSMRRAI